ncbi:hypothetical protein GCM10027082_19470 [Comamonas humi]
MAKKRRPPSPKGIKVPHPSTAAKLRNSRKRATGDLKLAIDSARSKINLAPPLGTLLHTSRQGYYIAEACTCNGLNDGCFKCGGVGIYPRHYTERPDTAQSVLRKKVSKPAPLGTHANDARGEGWTIRERGRFDTSPLRDDHDE